MQDFQPRVSVIIINWRGMPHIASCIRSVLASDYQNFHIVIVDNDPQSGDAAILRTTFGDSIHIIVNEQNIGYGGGANRGIAFAQTHHHPEYFWILNNDATVDPSALSELVQTAAANPTLGIIGGQIRYATGNRLYCLGGGKINLTTGIDRLWGWNRGVSQSFIPPFFSYINGCSFFIRASVIDAVGLFDERFFLYSEEVDYCLRAQKAGCKLGYAPNAIVYHEGTKSARFLSQTYLYYYLRSKLLVMKKHATWWQMVTFPAFFLGYYCFRFCYLSLLRQGRFPIAIMIRSISDFLRGRLGNQHIE